MLLSLAFFSLLAVCQAGLTRPTFPNVAHSTINPNVKISYKTPLPGTCVTAESTQKQYTGYVTLPPFTVNPVQNFTINTFFWFVEARQQPAPLTVWFNGGPGASSLLGMFQEMGPCEVVQLDDETYGTQSRLWGWDRSSNLLFIDQPNQAGLSYDVLRDGVWNATSDLWDFPGTVGTPPEYIYYEGTSPSRDMSQTTVTSKQSAHAIWHFLQTFLEKFPEYKRFPDASDQSLVAVNLVAESYGGIYLPRLAGVIRNQTILQQDEKLPAGTVGLKMDSIMVVNGLIDFPIQIQSTFPFMHDNNYNLSIITEAEVQAGLNLYSKPGGCADKIVACQSLAAVEDPEQLGNKQNVRDVCSDAVWTCIALQAPFLGSGRNVYDIRTFEPFSFPYMGYTEYLNSEPVQLSIGAAVNYSALSGPLFDTFMNSGDPLLSSQIEDLAPVLADGVRVSMMYGDADFICNWMGAETVAKTVANRISAAFGAAFGASTYEPISIGSGVGKGVVRQYGNFTFARVYDAGHFVPTYQPETAFTIFDRVIKGLSVATGEVVDLKTYKTDKGTEKAEHKNEVNTFEIQPLCFLRDFFHCKADKQQLAATGGGYLVGGVLWDSEQAVVSHEGHQPTGPVGVPGTFPVGTRTTEPTTTATTRTRVTQTRTQTRTRSTRTKTTRTGRPTRTGRNGDDDDDDSHGDDDDQGQDNNNKLRARATDVPVESVPEFRAPINIVGLPAGSIGPVSKKVSTGAAGVGGSGMAKTGFVYTLCAVVGGAFLFAFFG